MTQPAGAGGGSGSASFAASPIGLDRLVRKEVSLGAIRERAVPEDHIGLRLLAPFLEVESDDVIFDYIKNDSQDGLAPARAEDAEAELAQSDTLTYGQGRAAIIDWSLKHRTSASDVTRYRDNLLLEQAARGIGQNLNLNDPGRMVDQFQRKLAREEASRRRRLDNRIEWMIMQSMETNGISYNDGKIKFAVQFNRPSNQQDINVATDARFNSANLYDAGTDFDPIGDFLAMNEIMYDLYGVRLRKAITSQKVLNSFWNSSRFVAMAGIVVGGTPSSPIDLNYVTQGGWTPAAALAKIEQVTGINFQVYDSVYRTRPIGSQTVTNNRFLSEDKIFFYPEESELGEVDDTELGFAKTLTAPHPEGNWTSGFYEWELTEQDPWMHVRGTGIKAFPIFPYMDRTFTMKVLT